MTTFIKAPDIFCGVGEGEIEGEAEDDSESSVDDDKGVDEDEDETEMEDEDEVRDESAVEEEKDNNDDKDDEDEVNSDEVTEEDEEVGGGSASADTYTERWHQRLNLLHPSEITHQGHALVRNIQQGEVEVAHLPVSGH